MYYLFSFSLSHFLSKEMRQHLAHSMLEIANKEKQHATVINRFQQGVPSITVVVNGGWSKWAHKHSSAKSRAAVIFGSYTWKLLFMGVRNKFCAVWAVEANKGIDDPQHRCYHNWSVSSAAMESDIIAEEFSMSNQMHGLQYMSVIGDGDSSVMATIWQAVPYDIFVSKIECVNHIWSCLDNLQFRDKGGLTKKAIQRLTVVARIAIAGTELQTMCHSCDMTCEMACHMSSMITASRCSIEFCTFVSLTPHQQMTTSTNHRAHHGSVVLATPTLNSRLPHHLGKN